MKHTANQKAWENRDGTMLVPDKHVDAARLFAREGQTFDESELSRYPNAHEFFPSLPQPAPAVEQESGVETEEPEEIEVHPKKKGGRK